MKRLFTLLLFFLLVSPLADGAEKKTFRATTDPDGVQRVTMKGGEYHFDPNHVIVKVAVPVELSVTKEGGFVPHNIVMNAPEAGMEFDVDLGKEPKIIKFTPSKAGTYPFFCSKRFLFFKSHRAKGMEGVIEVIEQ